MAAVEKAEAALEAARAKTVELEAALAVASEGKASGLDRDAALRRLAAAEGMVAETTAALAEAASDDPAKVAALAEAASEAKAAANRWLDNIQNLKGWIGSKFGEGRGAEVDAFFEQVKRDKKTRRDGVERERERPLLTHSLVLLIIPSPSTA